MNPFDKDKDKPSFGPKSENKGPTVKKKNPLNPHKPESQLPGDPHDQQSNGQGQGPTAPEEEAKVRVKDYLNKSGKIGDVGMRKMMEAGLSEKQMQNKVNKFMDNGGEMKEATRNKKIAGDHYIGDMKEGAEMSDFDHGERFSTSDVRYLQRQGFADKKIKQYIQNNGDQVNERAQNLLAKMPGSSNNSGSGSNNSGNNNDDDDDSGGGGGGTSLNNAKDNAATKATLSGKYDVDDSPSATSAWVKQFNDLNTELQNQYPSEDLAGQYQQRAAEREGDFTQKLDERISARSAASKARGRVMMSQIYGDPEKSDWSWTPLKGTEEVEMPDFDIGAYTDF